jgi:hypothetical protein
VIPPEIWEAFVEAYRERLLVEAPVSGLRRDEPGREMLAARLGMKDCQRAARALEAAGLTLTRITVRVNIGGQRPLELVPEEEPDGKTD